MPEVGLNRAVFLPLVILYGLGTILGAGIYVLIGEVAGAAGYLDPASLLFAGIVACTTAVSFACLSSRELKAKDEQEVTTKQIRGR